MAAGLMLGTPGKMLGAPEPVHLPLPRQFVPNQLEVQKVFDTLSITVCHSSFVPKLLTTSLNRAPSSHPSVRPQESPIIACLTISA